MFKLELSLGRILGLIRKTKDGYELTEKGTYKYHLMEQVYTHQYIDKTWSVLRKDAWPDNIKFYNSAFLLE